METNSNSDSWIAGV